MYRLRVLGVGKGGEEFIKAGVAHYRQRIRPFAALDWVEIKPAAHAGKNTALAQREEGTEILRRIKPEDWLVALDERGDTLTTRQWAQWMENLQREGHSPTFVIGGAYGLDPAVKSRANRMLSLSALTLPHQLVRIVLLEQLYRVLTLMAGHQYHHD